MKPIASAADLASAVYDLEDGDSAVDLSAVRAAIDNIEAGRVRKLLRATMDLEAVKAQRGRRFLVAYYRNNNVVVTRGIAYAVEDEPKERPGREAVCDTPDEQPKRQEYGVLVDDYIAPFWCHYRSMQIFDSELEAHFGRGNYLVKYLD